jgi:2-keto-3-deoxy-galactonokinase
MQPRDLARNLLPIDMVDTRFSGCDVRIVPGMDIVNEADDSVLPDIMRGEETNVLIVIFKFEPRGLINFGIHDNFKKEVDHYALKYLKIHT